MRFNKTDLLDLYEVQKKSVSYIAKKYCCSQTGINYWLKKYEINKRSVSEAIYILKNPGGDPFSFQKPKNTARSFLLGLGLGLYWGEGNKKNKYSVRLGNSDPNLILKFIEFLEKIFNIQKTKLRFALQLFNDINPQEAVTFWQKVLHANEDQFYKVIVSTVRGPGTYKNKSQYGVLTIHFSNKKLRDLICNEIENLKKI